MTGRSMVAHPEGFKSGERAGRLAAAVEIERLRAALRAIISANNEFRKGMPETWDGDPLQDAVDVAAKLLLGVVGNAAPPLSDETKQQIEDMARNIPPEDDDGVTVGGTDV